MASPLVRFVCVLFLIAGTAATPARAQSEARRVVVNDVRLDAERLAALEARYGVRVLDGAYWYDAASGAWGLAGGPTAGFIPAGLRLGGPLRADASGGTTDVYVNGRRLPAADVQALQPLTGPVQPGRYWLDAQGNVGREGGPAFLNLVALARQARGGSGSAFFRSGNTGIGAGSSGGTSYVMGDGWSVTVDP